MVSSKIKSIKAREILDSRGYPTVEVDLESDFGLFRASIPAGTSKGKYEAKELRDGGQRYLGMGVAKAVKNVNKVIAPKLKGKDPGEQKKIDNLIRRLDGTENKRKLGANAILGVSLAVLRAGAGAQKIPLWQWIARLSQTKPSLPIPCLLYIEGGLHGRGDLDTQEFMAFLETDSFKDRIRFGTELYHTLREMLRKKFGKGSTNVGLEGGFTPPLQESKEALDLIVKAAKTSGHKINIILDMAASTFFQDGKYYFEGEIFDQPELLRFYSKLCQKYPIAAIEDPFSEEDWQGFQEITEKISEKVDIIGDDLLATNLYRIQKAEDKGACTGLILKPNQIGTVTETLETAQYAIENNWQVFVKHRSGETPDTFIADLSVGLGTGWIMAGAPNRGERVAKYNRLLRIEEELKIFK
ncbi:Enolase [subsurface metagenome]